MNYPNIFICGASGSGKSTSLRFLPPESTVIINTERKALPFRNASKFKKQVEVDNFNKATLMLIKALENKEVKYIIIESFTSLHELAYLLHVRNADKKGDGSFAAWGNYKDDLRDFINLAKNSSKIVVFIGIEAVTQDDSMRMIKTIDVQGSLKGHIEKEFEIVLWTSIQENNGNFEYKFQTNSDGKNKAKSPMEMFEDLYIENNLNEVIKTIKDYYRVEQAKAA